MYRKNAYTSPPPKKKAGVPWRLFVGLGIITGGIYVASAWWSVSHYVATTPLPAASFTAEEPLLTSDKMIGGMTAIEERGDTWVYWTVPDDGTVARASTKTPPIHETIASGEARPTDIIAGRANVFWVNEDGGIRARVAGGGLVDVVTGHVSPGSKLAIGLDSEAFGTVLFFTDPARDELDRVIVPAHGGGPQTPAAIVHDARFGISADLAADGTYVYWTAGSSIMRARVADGTAVELASSRRPSHLFLFHDALYWRRGAADGIGGHAACIEKLDLDVDVAGATSVIVAEEMTTDVASIDAPYLLDRANPTSFMLGGFDHVSMDRHSVFWTDGTHVFSKPHAPILASKHLPIP